MSKKRNERRRHVAASPRETAPLSVVFHALGAGGEAVGRDENNRTVFAPLAAPGDQALVKIVQSQPRFARARVFALIQLSPHRIAPLCPFYQSETDGSLHPECGGCQWQHIEYSMQRETKRDLVVQALQRIGKIEISDEIIEACVAAPQEFSYRNKADFVVEARNNSENDESKVGFFAPDSHRVVDIAHCLIQSETNNALLKTVRIACARGLVAPFDERSGRGVLRRFIARTSSNGEAILVLETTNEVWPQQDEFVALVRQKVPQVVGVLRRTEREEARLLSGRDWLEETVDGLRLRVTGDGFFQINTAMTPLLLQTALCLANVHHADRVLDLYCGVGLFALGAARLGAQVTGIEYNAQAIESARFNAKINGFLAEFIAGDAAATLRCRALTRRKKQLDPERFDVILLDPPRAGAAECLDEIAQLRPERIVYISCDAATLARDVRRLGSLGFRLTRAVPLDLFPQTAHVETIALLQRADYSQ